MKRSPSWWLVDEGGDDTRRSYHEDLHRLNTFLTKVQRRGSKDMQSTLGRPFVAASEQLPSQLLDLRLGEEDGLIAKRQRIRSPPRSPPLASAFLEMPWHAAMGEYGPGRCATALGE